MAVVKVQQDAGKRRSSTYRKWFNAFPRLWYSVVAREPLWRRNVGWLYTVIMSAENIFFACRNARQR